MKHSVPPVEVDVQIDRSNVGINDPLTKKRVLDVRIIDSAAHSGLETVRLGVIQLLEISDCLLLLVLEICEILVI